MWGCEPNRLTSDWAPSRIELRQQNEPLFKGEWQGLPIGGYTKMFEKMIDGIPIQYETPFVKNGHDLVIFSGRVDELFDFCFGELEYRGLKFDYKIKEEWENHSYGTINLSQHDRYIRKANFKVLHQQKDNWIQYQEPIKATVFDIPMYPVNTSRNEELFELYLKKACLGNIIPVGRLGLYKYLNMDKAIGLAMGMIYLILEWQNLSPEDRYKLIKEALSNY